MYSERRKDQRGPHPGAGSIRETSPEKHEKGWKSDFQCKGQLIRLNQEELKYPKTGDNR